MRARYYDPVTTQWLSVDPLVSQTNASYNYANNDPLNASDPSGLGVHIPGTDFCIKSGPDDDSCHTAIDKFKKDHPKTAQRIANGAGGVLDGITAGHERTITGGLGIGDRVNRCSGEYLGGQIAGAATLGAILDGASTPVGEDIVGTAHDVLRPTQDSVEQAQVEEYMAQLQGGESVPPIDASSDGYILDGHHRYVASQRTGIPVDVRVSGSAGGPIGLPDWSTVFYE
jgi:hypothetical protein